RDRGHPDQAGQEHRLRRAELAGLVQAQGGLQLADRLRGLDGELVRGRVEIAGRSVAERDEISVELPYVRTGGDTLRQLAIQHRRAVQQHYRLAVDLVKHVALPDDVPRAWYRGDRSRGLIRDRVAAGVSEGAVHVHLRGQIPPLYARGTGRHRGRGVRRGHA